MTASTSGPSAAVLLVLVSIGLLASLGSASAEPILLSKQYARCTTCHYSPTGGGLLTPYGRSLSREEISMFGARGEDATAEDAGIAGEEAFLGSALRNALGPVQLGIELRPSHLEVSVGDRTLVDRNFFMNADLLAAYQRGGWTLYGQIGRQPEADGGKIDSYEHWAGYQAENGVGVRAGRFLPAYGVRFADHTTFSRSSLGLAQYDQVYGVEVSLTGDRSLLQLSAGPGLADALIDDDGRRGFTASGRFQFDLDPRTVAVASALYRDESDFDPRSTAVGGALGFAPHSRLTTWTQLDLVAQDRFASNRRYVFVHQTSVEAIPGLWFRVSPQVGWASGDPQAEVRRLALGLDAFPRTHWHVNVS